MQDTFVRVCMVCEKELKTALDNPSPSCAHDVVSPIDEATIWKTDGNYGSSYDPIGKSEFLVIFVCDDCLNKKAHFAYRCEAQEKHLEIVDVKVFQPHEDD